MRIALLCLVAMAVQSLSAQELFVFSEPASNMPANSVSAKLTAKFPNSKFNNDIKQRYMPEIMFGVSKQLMVHVSSTFSDYYSYKLKWESAKFYAKWRFYSNDDVHKHFRMAAFAEGSYSESPFYFGDVNLDGDNSGIQGGIIATQLINKLAVSGTASFIRVFAETGEHTGHDEHSLNSLSYTLSAGYLLFPRNYTDYRQTNLNVYVEMLGMRGLKQKHYMLDIAPAVQLILNSNFKINAGYRFQVRSNMLRVGEQSWLFGVERTFLGAFHRKKK